MALELLGTRKRKLRGYSKIFSQHGTTAILDQSQRTFKQNFSLLMLEHPLAHRYQGAIVTHLFGKIGLSCTTEKLAIGTAVEKTSKT